MSKPIGIMYATSGGRYPFMAGVADALENYLINEGYNIVFRMGASGGSLVSAIQSSGEPFHEWMERAAHPSVRRALKIGGFRYLSNFWSYMTNGGFLKSEDVQGFVENTITKPLTAPTYAVSWCESSKKPVAFRLTDENLGSRIAASCAMPVGLTPMTIQNKTLEPRIREALGVEDSPDAFSTFRDGGLCTGFPLTMIEGICTIPVIVVSIDIRVPGQRPEPINFVHRVLANEMRSKIMDNVNEIAARRHLTVFCIPCPEYINRKYAVKFDLTQEEGTSMYKVGKTMGEARLWMTGLQLPDPEPVETPEAIAVAVLTESLETSNP